MSEMAIHKNDRWSNGRCVLTGDAAWGIGMGTTSEALVGAYILAGELTQHGDDHAAAFAAAERYLRPITDAAQKQPPGAPWVLHPPSRYGRFVLWTVLRTVAALPLGFIARWLPSGKAKPLPRYEGLPVAE